MEGSAYVDQQSPSSRKTAGSTLTTQFQMGLVRSLVSPLMGSSKKVLGSILLFSCRLSESYLSRSFLDLRLMKESTFFSNMFSI